MIQRVAAAFAGASMMPNVPMPLLIAGEIPVGQGGCAFAAEQGQRLEV
jgi:hypothetical protein